MLSFYELTWFEKILFLKKILGSFVLKTIKGAIASFADCIGGKAKSVVCDIVPNQSGSGTPSPDNVRPISGWTATDVNVCGKNLLDKSKGLFLANNAIFGGTSTEIDGSLVLPSGTYTFSISEIQNGIYIDTEEGRIKTVYTATSASFTLSKTQAVKLTTYKGVSDVSVIESYDYQLELGSTASDYQPYQGQTYEVDWSDEVGTIYGGTVDAVSGVVTVTALPLVFSSADPWSLSSGNFFYRTYSQIQGTVVSGYYVTENGIRMHLNPNNGQIRAYFGDNPILTDSTDMATLVGGYKLIYNLQTPLEYTISEQQIALLKGSNNVWSTSGGQTEVTYKAEA